MASSHDQAPGLLSELQLPKVGQTEEGEEEVIEHTTKRGDEYMVKLPDWFIEKEGL